MQTAFCIFEMKNHDLQQTLFHKTSIDIARKQASDTTEFTGVKRTQDQRSPQRSSSECSIAAASNNNEDGRKTRPSFDFKRPSLHSSTSGRRLQASIIRDAEQADGATDKTPYSQRTARRGTPELSQIHYSPYLIRSTIFRRSWYKIF